MIAYGKAFLDSVCEKQIAIDGKKLRGTRPTSKGTKGDYILNAFVCENQLVIGQLALEDKENEITAIPKILDKINIEGATVTIDAIGVQVGIARKILDKGGHYMLAIKNNHKYTHEAIDEAFRFHSSEVLDTYEEKNVGHDWIEVRTCRILPAEVMKNEDVDGR